jgi:hypothetical protein
LRRLRRKSPRRRLGRARPPAALQTEPLTTTELPLTTLTVRMVRALASRSFAARSYNDAVACGPAAAARVSCERMKLHFRQCDCRANRRAAHPIGRRYEPAARRIASRCTRRFSAGPSYGARSGAAAELGGAALSTTAVTEWLAFATHHTGWPSTSAAPALQYPQCPVADPMPSCW